MCIVHCVLSKWLRTKFSFTSVSYLKTTHNEQMGRMSKLPWNAYTPAPHKVNSSRTSEQVISMWNSLLPPIQTDTDRDRSLLCFSLLSFKQVSYREQQMCGDFSRSSHTSDLKIGTPVATLPGTWRYRVSAGTGWFDVSILWLGEVESWICNFYLSVAARAIVWADPSLRHTSMLLGRWAVNKPTNHCSELWVLTWLTCVALLIVS